jgi:hypothetical protein
MNRKLLLPFRIIGGLAVALTLALAPAARADFEILVTEGGGPTIPIVDGGPLDNNPGDPTIIDVNTAGLNALLVDYNFSQLGATSNRLTGTPFSNDAASLSVSGNAFRSTLAGVATITVQAFDTDYLFPAADPKTMTTAAADIFRNTTAGDSRTFQSSFDPSNSTPPGPGVTSPLLAFVPPVGTGPFGTSNPGVATPLGAQPTPFGISNTTVITLGPSSSAQSAQSDQFSGATTITAVPEPASVCLVVVGLGLMTARRLRSRNPRD